MASGGSNLTAFLPVHVLGGIWGDLGVSSPLFLILISSHFWYYSLLVEISQWFELAI